MPNHSEDEKEEDEHEVPFFPNVLLSEMSLAFAAIGLLAIFVSLFPLKLGEKFDRRAFHDRVLEEGALPLSLLEARVRSLAAEANGSSAT